MIFSCKQNRKSKRCLFADLGVDKEDPREFKRTLIVKVEVSAAH